MAAFVDCRGGLSPDTLHARLFAGDVLIFRGLTAVAALVDLVDRRIRGAFPEGPPETAADLPAAAFLARMAALRKAFDGDPEADAAWRGALEACGCRLRETFWDRRHLRANPPGDTHHDNRVRNLPAHRDSWGSMVAQQINWWAPVYPLAPGRTLLIYPDVWNRAIANDSGQWDLDVLKRRRASGASAAYPSLPTACNPAEWGAPRPLLPEPGDIVAFSAAHLHASAVNDTGRTRFNVETRTVDAAMRRAARGAPNADGRAPRVAAHWFRHCETGELLDRAAP